MSVTDNVVEAAIVGNFIARGGQYAHRMSQDSGDGEKSVFDVWTHSYDGLASLMREVAGDPVGFLKSDLQQQGRLDPAALAPTFRSLGQVRRSMAAQVDGLRTAVSDVAKAQGAMQTVGATFALLTGVEQLISSVMSCVPFPALPAVRIADLDIGMPHSHAHPPNLIPPAPPVVLPSSGPVIPIPLFSGANQTLINGLPAARCGDMGLAIWCGGYFPMYEILLGSSNVWIEGARAARMMVDITKHCIFTAPRPQDLPIGSMIGTTVMGSPNVLIGGVPMPSLTSIALGFAAKGVFKLGSKAGRRAMAQRRVARLRASDPVIRKVLTKQREVRKSLIKHPEAIPMVKEAIERAKKWMEKWMETGTMPAPTVRVRSYFLKPNQLKISQKVDAQVPGDKVTQLRSASQKDFDSYVKHLYKNAKGAQEELKAFSKRIADTTEGKAKSRRRPKKRKRAIEKIHKDYEGDPSKLTDIAASRVIYPTLDDLYVGLQKIQDELELSDELELVYFKDRFIHPLKTGYCDIQMQVRTSNGHIAELQLCLEPIERVSVYQHSVFEVYRSLKVIVEKEIGCMTPAEHATMEALLKSSQRAFAEAFPQKR